MRCSPSTGASAWPSWPSCAAHLAVAGGEYKVYKNTLVRLAVADGPEAPIQDLLTGPTAIAFVDGDVSAVAKALRDFARTNPSLVVKGGIVGDGLLSASEITVLADLPSRDVLLAQVAGAFAAPMQQLAGLIEALPRNLAYGLAALVAKRGDDGAAEAEAPATEAPSEAAAEAERPGRSRQQPAAEAAQPSRRPRHLRQQPGQQPTERRSSPTARAGPTDRNVDRPTSSKDRTNHRPKARKEQQDGRHPDQGPDSGRHR